MCQCLHFVVVITHPSLRLSALQIMLGFSVLSDSHCELEVILLCLKTLSESARLSVGDETDSILIQFVSDLLLSSVQNHHLHQVRMEKALASYSLQPHDRFDSLTDILSAPLAIPQTASVIAREEDTTAGAVK